MHKLTIEVDLDLNIDPDVAGEIIGNLIQELQRLAQDIYNELPSAKFASGLVISPLEDDELAGNWRIDEK